MPEITVVVKSHRRHKALQACLESIVLHAPYAEILVIDDGDCPLPKQVARMFEVNYIKLPFDVGIGAKSNESLIHVHTPYVAMYEDDFVLTDQTQLYEQIRTLNDVKATCLGCIPFGSGRWAGTFERTGRRLAMHFGSIRDATGNVVWYDFIPNCWIARTADVRNLGWDARLRVQEHWEFFYRAKLAGWKVGQDKRRSLIHNHDSSDAVYNSRRHGARVKECNRIGRMAHGLASVQHVNKKAIHR